jgi:uncharacterized protein (TIGR03435 family)
MIATMTAHAAPKLAVKQRLLLSAVGLAVVAAPFAFGQTTLPKSTSAPQKVDTTAETLRFAVATIKPNLKNDGRWRLEFSRYGYSAIGVPVHMLIQDAYGMYEDGRILGEAGWVSTQKYDVEAKVDDSDAAAFQKLKLSERRVLLQALLADRFKLVLHGEKRERPVYALVIAKSGPRLEKTKPDQIPANPAQALPRVTRSRPGELTLQWMTMSSFAGMLSDHVDRMVVDQTGLTGHYDFKLDWTPENATPATNAPNGASTSPDPSGPSIFTALQEQLGLKLESTKAPVEVLVIDHIEAPSEN